MIPAVDRIFDVSDTYRKKSLAVLDTCLLTAPLFVFKMTIHKPLSNRQDVAQ